MAGRRLARIVAQRASPGPAAGGRLQAAPRGDRVVSARRAKRPDALPGRGGISWGAKGWSPSPAPTYFLRYA